MRNFQDFFVQRKKSILHFGCGMGFGYALTHGSGWLLPDVFVGQSSREMASWNHMTRQAYKPTILCEAGVSDMSAVFAELYRFLCGVYEYIA